MAEAFQQQVAAAGIRAKIVQVPTDGYFDQIWMKRPVSMTRWNDRPADGVLNEVYRGGARWNESFLKDAKFDSDPKQNRAAKLKAAREFAIQSLDLTLGEYGVLNRPPVWRDGLQSFLYMYKVYPTTVIQLFRRLDRKAQIAMLGMMLMLSGMTVPIFFKSAVMTGRRSVMTASGLGLSWMSCSPCSFLASATRNLLEVTSPRPRKLVASLKLASLSPWMI
jgi:hypothetical protein